MPFAPDFSKRKKKKLTTRCWENRIAPLGGEGGRREEKSFGKKTIQTKIDCTRNGGLKVQPSHKHATERIDGWVGAKQK